MKVAFVTWKFPALANTFVVNQIVDLQRRGHVVEVLSLQDADEQVVHESVAAHRLLDRTHYVSALVPDDRPALSAALYPYARDSLWERVHAVPSVARRLREREIDVVHACFANNSATFAMLVAAAAELPFTFECHAYDLFVDFKLGAEKVAAAERIFAISEYNRRHLVERIGCPPEKVLVRRVPIDQSVCDTIRSTAREQGLVVYVGRLHPIKGLHHALSAFQRVVQRLPGARFVLVGDGGERESLEAHARSLGLAGRVRFTGGLPNAEALRYMARAEAFLLPSVPEADGDRDGIPTSLIESMYLGTPAVSTTVSGIPELIAHERNGLLAAPGDVAGIAAQLERLLFETSLREHLAAAAHETVRTRFSAAASTDALLCEWQRILAERPRRGLASSRAPAPANVEAR